MSWHSINNAIGLAADYARLALAHVTPDRVTFDKLDKEILEPVRRVARSGRPGSRQHRLRLEHAQKWITTAWGEDVMRVLSLAIIIALAVVDAPDYALDDVLADDLLDQRETLNRLGLAADAAEIEARWRWKDATGGRRPPSGAVWLAFQAILDSGEVGAAYEFAGARTR